MRTAVCVLVGLAYSGAARLFAGDVPLGHPDYYPSPEHPIGQRGDGTGFYPGAVAVTAQY